MVVSFKHEVTICLVILEIIIESVDNYLWNCYSFFGLLLFVRYHRQNNLIMLSGYYRDESMHGEYDDMFNGTVSKIRRLL